MKRAAAGSSCFKGRAGAGQATVSAQRARSRQQLALAAASYAAQRGGWLLQGGRGEAASRVAPAPALGRDRASAGAGDRLGQREPTCARSPCSTCCEAAFASLLDDGTAAAGRCGRIGRDGLRRQWCRRPSRAAPAAGAAFARAFKRRGRGPRASVARAYYARRGAALSVQQERLRALARGADR